MSFPRNIAFMPGSNARKFSQKTKKNYDELFPFRGKPLER